MNVMVEKPFIKLWGYEQAKLYRATDLYNYIYEAFTKGFKDIENPIEVQEYGEGIYELYVDLLDYSNDFLNTEENVTLLKNTILNVVTDNPMFLYNVSDTKIGNTIFEGIRIDVDWIGIGDELIVGFSIYAPIDSVRENAKIQIKEATLNAKKKIVEEARKKYPSLTHYNINTENQRRDVTKIIHDWLLTRDAYEYNERTYWSNTIYSLLVEEDPKPTCVAYSVTMNYLCRSFGINCIYVEGNVRQQDSTTGEYIWNPHSWNLLSFVNEQNIYSRLPSDWTAIDLTWDDGRYDAQRNDCWGYFCTYDVYHHKGSQEVTRVNDINHYYPVDVPAKYYPYYGTSYENDLYDITKWESL